MEKLNLSKFKNNKLINSKNVQGGITSTWVETHYGMVDQGCTDHGGIIIK